MKGHSPETLRQFERPYELKEPSYFGSPRRDYIDALPVNRTANILELGCGNGATGALALKEGKCGTYVGIELFEPMAKEAGKVLTAVHHGNVEHISLPYPEETFDALIMSEVLEHLATPEEVLGRLVKLVKKGGRVFASSPNIAHWRPILGLFQGRFQYTDSGLMDRTHVRWFTPVTFRQLFTDAGVVIDHLGSVGEPPALNKIISKILGQRFSHLLCHQINVIGRRAN